MIRWTQPFALLSLSLNVAINHASLAATENQSSVPSSYSHQQDLDFIPEIYGVDVSFPMHHNEIRQGINPLGDRQKFYDDFMNGCRENAKEYASGCDETEADRIDSNLRQPAFMVNFTENVGLSS